MTSAQIKMKEEPQTNVSVDTYTYIYRYPEPDTKKYVDYGSDSCGDVPNSADEKESEPDGAFIEHTSDDNNNNNNNNESDNEPPNSFVHDFINNQQNNINSDEENTDLLQTKLIRSDRLKQLNTTFKFPFFFYNC